MRQPRWLPGLLLLTSGAVFGGVVVALGTAGGGLQETGAALRRWTPESHQPAAAPGVVVRTLQPANVLDTVSAWGRLRPERLARLAFRAPGKLVERPVELGSPVKAGQVVARLDRAVAEAAVAEAKALLAKARADLDRLVRLAASTAPAEREAAEAQVAVRAAAVVRAQDHLGAHTLTAPFDGVVASVGAEPGSGVAAGMVVVSIGRPDPMVLELPLAPHRVPSLRTGMAVDVRVDGWPDHRFDGVLSRIPPGARPADGLFVCEVRIPNGDGRLRAGYVAHGAIARGTFEQVLVLPRRAVEETPAGVHVNVVVNGTIQKVSLADPIRLDDRVLTRTDALRGAQVVVAGPRPLAAGTRVRAFPEGSESVPRVAGAGR